jgi:hypothetical protein
MHFKVEELAGSLIKSGRFKEAIPRFTALLGAALDQGVVTENEYYEVLREFMHILLNPSDFNQVQEYGNKILSLNLRLHRPTSTEKLVFDKNLKESRGLN